VSFIDWFQSELELLQVTGADVPSVVAAQCRHTSDDTVSLNDCRMTENPLYLGKYYNCDVMQVTVNDFSRST